MKNTFTAPVAVYISQHSHHDAISLQEVKDTHSLCIWPASMEQIAGYTKVGTGSVTVTIDSPDNILAGKVGALRAELAKDRIESQARQNALIDKINKLEALTFDASGVAA